MSAKQDSVVRQKLAASIQTALHNHRVIPEAIGDTMDFLANIIGATAEMLFPPITVDEVIDKIKDEVEYGMEHGIPED